ncbi:porin family protein [Colwellia demingiae]|uniref:Porin family protein n=1 Tax=Colwellia demingiae TaxID=89401 RepID=A0A5C6QIH4_9GAMM|nr:outer membrane beta-barrel protein [Colwellia demingiae]TWX68661.1 porin family protein [Colwellia demingiae]
MRVILAMFCALTIISMPTMAKPALEFEITPLIGYRFGGDFDTTQDNINNRIELSDETSYGLLTAWSFDRKRQGEFLISHYNTNFSESSDFSASNTGLGITYAHLGGNVPISEGPIPFYLTGGLGLTHLAPNDKQLSNETRFSVNIGLASKIELSERFSLRLDSRVYGTFFNSDSAIFCDVETCAIYISSSIWVQTEVSVGLTYRF